VPCWPGKGEVIGWTLGVDLRAGGALVTRGTSFQLSIFFTLAAGVTDEGVVFRGGPPIGGGARGAGAP
jgi:hypothetical protein